MKAELAIILLWPAISAWGQEVGSKACSACHMEIYRKYSATAMARSSGSVAGTAVQGQSRVNSLAGVEYRVSTATGGYRLQFERQDAEVRGERLLRWFVGSGRVGRSYLFATDGFLFQSPVSYYAQEKMWDVSPGYRRSDTIHLARPVEAGCLQCHASRLQTTAGTQNGFRDPPFLEGGVSCERCHGLGKDHVARMSSGTRGGPKQIVNPARLDAARRDSVCAQCHLTGAARIARVRARQDAFRAGELLSDYSAVFVWADAAGAPLSVNSHFEKLHQSTCARSAGEKLWCGSCHDPHTEPTAAERAEFYRRRCQKCHEPAQCKESAANRRAAQDDCAGCHMPKNPVRDAEHAVYTDHSIPRRPRPAVEQIAAKSLQPFWNVPADARDLALAYAAAAADDARTIELLRAAEAANPRDAQILLQLAQALDRTGDDAQAAGLYERVLRLDPTQASAAANLGVCRMQSGDAKEAVRLWSAALSRNPGLSGTRINLGVAQYQMGEKDAGLATLRAALRFDPDNATARKLLDEMQAGLK